MTLATGVLDAAAGLDAGSHEGDRAARAADVDESHLRMQSRRSGGSQRSASSMVGRTDGTATEIQSLPIGTVKTPNGRSHGYRWGGVRLPTR